MNKPRGRNYKRFPCELTPKQIEQTKQIGDQVGIAYTEVVRRALDFAYSNPVFLISLSKPGNFQEFGK